MLTAWEISIPYLAAGTFLTSVLEGFVGGLTGDFSGVGRSSQQAELVTQQLQTAHQVLDRIAAAHGARIPTQ